MRKLLSAKSTRLALILPALACSNLGYSQIADAELSKIVATLEGSDFSARYDARMQLQDEVSQASLPGQEKQRALVEAQLAGLLGGNVSSTTKIWILRQLASIGSAASVDSVAKLLGDSDRHVADAARMALDANPAEAATRALVAGFDAAKEKDAVIGYMLLLDQRGGDAVVTAIANRLRSDDLDIVNAAAMALAQSSSPAASSALSAFYGTAPAAARGSVELALVSRTRDAALCEKLVRDGASAAVRLAAFNRLLKVSPGKAAKLLKAMLADASFPVKGELIQVGLASGKSALAREVLRAAPSLDAADQAILVGALATQPQSSKNEKAILAIAASDSEPLKIQAIEALGKVGSSASLPLVLEALKSKSRELREAAELAVASIPDSRVDGLLVKSAQKGEGDSRTIAIRALGFRNVKGATGIINELATSSDSPAIREAAIEAMEAVGNEETLATLVKLIISEPNSGGMRRDAQLAIKRLTLRITDTDAIWAAFADGLQSADTNADAKNALLAVIDSSPTKPTINYLRGAWKDGDAETRKTILRVLPAWRDFDGGTLLMEIAEMKDTSESDRDACFSGIGRLILASGESSALKGKFELAERALKSASTDKQRQSIIGGFRNATWREQNYLKNNKVNPEIEKAINAASS